MARLMLRVVALAVLAVIPSSRAPEIRFAIALAARPASPQNVVAEEVAARIVKDTGGVGLGLTSAHAIIREHGGDHRVVHSARGRRQGG